MQGVEVEHQVARGRRAVQARHAGLLVVDAAGAQLGASLQWFVGHCLRNAAVDDVDRAADGAAAVEQGRSEEHTSELQSLMRISYAVFCLKKKNKTKPAK